MKRPGPKSSKSLRKPATPPSRRKITSELDNKEKKSSVPKNDKGDVSEEIKTSQSSDESGENSVLDPEQEIQQSTSKFSEILVGEVAVLMPLLVLEVGVFFLSGAGSSIFPDSFSELIDTPFSVTSFALVMTILYLVFRVLLRSYEIMWQEFSNPCMKGVIATLVATSVSYGFFWRHKKFIQQTFATFYSKNILILWILKHWDYCMSEWNYFWRLVVLIITFQLAIAVLSLPYIGLKWVFNQFFEEEIDENEETLVSMTKNREKNMNE